MAKLCINTIKKAVRTWEVYKTEYPVDLPMDEKISEFAQFYLEHLELESMKDLHADKDGLWKIFWDIYPRKVGKKNAMRAFLKLNPEQQDKAVTMVPKYKILTDMYAQDYLHASTYLNQERFNDDELEAIPSGKEISHFFTFVQKILGVNELNQLHIMKAARLIMVHKATATEAKQVAQWMNDVWGADAEWRSYVNLNTLLNDKKWKERVIKAKDYLNGK